MRQTISAHWQVVRFKHSFQWIRQADQHDLETWLMHPDRRYCLTSTSIAHVADHVLAISDLKNAGYYRPLLGHVNLHNATVLIERDRDRGVGDYMFLTGPMAYLHHLSGGTVKLSVPMLTDRGSVFFNLPLLHHRIPLYGPTIYDAIPSYNYHWFVDSVTEFDEEPEQLNVYDALYKQLGLPYASIDPKFKRPTVTLVDDDITALNTFYSYVYQDRHLDLRKLGYYVVAPLSHSTLRSMPYATWLKLIKLLSARRPVIVVGQIRERMPNVDITFADFYNRIAELGDGVINLISEDTPLRLVMALISKAVGVVCLDSAPLYIAEAFRIPAVSIWGPHHPGVRIGYDQDYMDLAVWFTTACRHSPCFAYHGFPHHKCPRGQSQAVCEVLAGTDVEMILKKVNQMEDARPKFTTFSSPMAEKK